MPREELAESMNGEDNNIHYFEHGTGWNLCCKQATYLLLKKEEKPKLSFKEEVALAFHMAICKFCKAFKKQSALMNRFINETVTKTSLQMGEKEKRNLKVLIDSSLKEN